MRKTQRLSGSITPAINSKCQSVFDEALCLNDQAGPLELRSAFWCLTMGNTLELVKAKMAIASKKSKSKSSATRSVMR